jgi:large repetitive protein
MFALIPRLCSLAPAGRPTRAGPRWRSVVPRLVPLEGRTMPAGNVTVSVVAGDLIIKGDNNAAGNQIVVNETSSGSYTVGGLTGTTVNGAPAFVASGITRDVRANFGAGNDSIALNTSFFPRTDIRDVIVNMGAGNDSAVIHNVRARNVTVSQSAADSGADTVEVDVGVGAFGGRISGNVAITNQRGSSNVTVTAAIGGNLAISNQDGDDTINVASASRIGGSVTIANTAGTVGNSVTMDAHVGRNVTIANPGAGSSTARLDNNAVVGENLHITDGAGSNDIELSGVTVCGSTLVTGGAGNDVVRSDTSNTTEFFGGNVTLNLGQGSNLVVLSGIPNGARSTIGGNLTVTSGNGGIAAALEAINVAGTTLVSTGAGNDDVTVNDCLFGRNFLCNLGDGADHFEVESFTLPAGATGFLGNLAINAGAGTDSVDIATASVATVVNAYGAVSITQAETLTSDPTNAHHIGHGTFL